MSATSVLNCAKCLSFPAVKRESVRQIWKLDSDGRTHLAGELWKARKNESLFRRIERNGVAMSTLRILGTVLVLAFGAQPIQFARAAESAVVNPLMLKELADIPGKEMLMITVDYPPGAVDPVHRHDAHAFVYVLQGSIVMQVQGGKEVTLAPGQTFYEGPNDVHTVGRNASTTEPAKFIVILLKKKGVDVVLPAE